eukprot:scaffold710_cov171-Amphora_coffeaeformis.AAC.46
MLGLPALFARSGIIPTCCTVVVVSCLCSFCSLHLANTISKVEGNGNFKKEIEYSTAFGFFWGPAWFTFTQVVFFFCILCLNVSSIVDTAQVVDTFFGNWWPWGGTAGINISRDTLALLRWDYSFCSETERSDGLCSPFSQTEGSVLTLGNLVVTLFLLPLALLPLKENAWWQALGFVVLLLTSLQFVVTFLVSGLDLTAVSLWGDDWDDLFGVVLFNFALVIAVPAWLYEREPDVDVPSVVHGSCALSALLYIVIGVLGHMAIPNVSDNMLQSIMSGALGVPVQLGATLFAFAIVGLGIPLFSVLTRLNLVGSGLCSERSANLLAVYFPFVLSWFLNDTGSITKVLSWGGMIFTGLIAFILPIVLALHVNKVSDHRGSVDVVGNPCSHNREFPIASTEKPAAKFGTDTGSSLPSKRRDAEQQLRSRPFPICTVSSEADTIATTTPFCHVY